MDSIIYFKPMQISVRFSVCIDDAAFNWLTSLKYRVVRSISGFICTAVMNEKRAINGGFDLTVNTTSTGLVEVKDKYTDRLQILVYCIYHPNNKHKKESIKLTHKPIITFNSAVPYH